MVLYMYMYVLHWGVDFVTLCVTCVLYVLHVCTCAHMQNMGITSDKIKDNYIEGYRDGSAKTT